jgi:hypothetical protein
MKKTLLSALILVLAACLSPSGDNPAPQVIVTPEVTITPPAPIPTPTPIAVDGVATIDGVLYVFNEAAQEWVALPELEAEFERVAVTEDGRVVALDANNAEIYELNAAGEWMMAVPVEWREFAQSLPEGARLDAEAGRVYDALNNVLYVLDAETNEWREPKAENFSELFPAVWHETFIGEVDGFRIPLTIGYGDDIRNHPDPNFRIRKIGLTEEGAEAMASLFLHSAWGRHRMESGNEEVSYQEYLDLLRQGKGNVRVMIMDDNGITRRMAEIDPRQGVSVLLTVKKNMPVMIANGVGFYLGVGEETGRLFLADNEYLRLKPGQYEKHTYTTYIHKLFDSTAIALGGIPNTCMQSGDVLASCGILTMPDDFQDWHALRRSRVLAYMNGESQDPLVIVER